jgi:hypothetical protein
MSIPFMMLKKQIKSLSNFEAVVQVDTGRQFFEQDISLTTAHVSHGFKGWQVYLVIGSSEKAEKVEQW